jgi:ATP synthase I chain
VTTPDVTVPTGATVPRKAVVNLGRATRIAAGLGVASFVVLAPMGYPLVAVFFCAGLALGLFNTALVARSAKRFAASADPNKRAFTKRAFAVSVLGRLTLITGLAVGLALLLRPAGLGVFAGLAALQLVMIFIAALPLVKELRQSGVGGLP